jgi:phosphate:Na+ symporter
MMEMVFHIVGGLALFLYGLFLLSGGFKKFAGSKIKDFLAKLTANPVKGIGLGAFFTVLIQSSSVMVVTLIGLLNAGLLSLGQAISVMVGEEIGTTITAQLIAFKVGLYALPVIAIGFVFYFFSKRQKFVYIGQVLLGFGILFLGMTFMSQGAKPLSQLPFFENMLTVFSQHILLGVLAGMIFTFLIQSSSATSGLVIAMGLQGVITLPVAIALILGANLGTCITGFLAALPSSLNAKRLALAQFLKNLIGVIILLPLLASFVDLIELTSNDLARQIANAHTVFNVGIAVLLLPLLGRLESLVRKILPGQSNEVMRGAKFLDDKLLSTPSLAIFQAQKEVARMAEITGEMLDEAKQALFQQGNKKLVLYKAVREKEDCVDELHGLIDHYLVVISGLDLSEEDSQRVALLIHSVTDIERVADHANNLAQLAVYQKEKKIKFSERASKELDDMFCKARQSFTSAVLALEKSDENLARQVLRLEEDVNRLDEQLQANHYERLKQGICDPSASPSYLKALQNLERISDHSENIASGLLTGF